MPVLTRPRRLTALERTRMTPDEELERLVAEQRLDDTHRVAQRGGQISLDANAYGQHHKASTIGSDHVGRDPWELVDAAIDLGLDPAEVAYSGDLIVSLPRRRGLLLGGGLVDGKRIPHGTPGGYTNHKCQCVPCTAAWATYARERRAARKARS